MSTFLSSKVQTIKSFTADLSRDIAQAARAIGKFSVVVVTLRGEMYGSKDAEQVTLLYVGRSLNLAHYKKKFFKEATIVQSHNTNLLSYRKHMDAAVADADVLFVDIGWPYSGRINKHNDYLELPDWVCMVTTLEPTWEQTFQNCRKTMRKNINRLIRKNGYTCEATNDPATAKQFYDDYYKAFIHSRHSGEVFETPRAIIEGCGRNGIILKVVGADGPVAAGVYFRSGDTLCLLVTGMPEALLESPPEAAMSALYLFSLRHAFDNGFKTLNFMGTRAFPNDGLFQFKRKWGAAVKDSFSINSVLFKPLNNSPMAAKFCEAFPMIARKNGNLELVLCTTEPTVSNEDCDRLVANTHCGGLDSVRIVHVTDQTTETTPCSTTQIPPVQVARTPLTTLSETYIGAGGDG